MKGLQILLQSLGIRIDPAEIEGAWARTKDAIPKLAAAVEENNRRLASIDAKLSAIEGRLDLTRADSDYTRQAVIDAIPLKMS